MKCAFERLEELNTLNSCAKDAKFEFGRIKITFAESGDKDLEQIFFPTQVHGTHIVKYLPDLSRSTEADGTYTASPNTPIAVRTADCLPIVLYGERNDSNIMSLHAGWRGYRENIIEKGVKTLTTANELVKEMGAFIGPAISSEAFEIGPEVFNILNDYKVLSEAEFQYCSRKGKNDRWHFDLQLAACLVLLRLGIAPDKITVIRECTYKSRTWNSFRRDSKNCGHNFTVVQKI